MTVIDDSGLPEAERDTVRVALLRDPALEPELRMILAALPQGSRDAFWRAFARVAADGRPPAAAVLEGLVDAAGGTRT